MGKRSRTGCSSIVAENLLTFRRNLADSDFLQRFFFSQDESRFVDSTYNYWIRLRREDEVREKLDVFATAIPRDVREELSLRVRRQIVDRLPDEYSSLVKLSPKTDPADSVRNCLAEREQRLKYELPSCIPYAVYYCEINRLIKRFDAGMDIRPTTEEFDVLFDRLSMRALRKARRRFPNLWDETKGHLVLDSRGARFAKALATGLRKRGYLLKASQFVDLGSGTGTMVAAVNRYTEANATGIERHNGVMCVARSMIRRLVRKQCISSDRIKLMLGDFLRLQSVDLARYDVLHVYSPIGKWEINVDDVIDRMRTGAILAVSNRPDRHNHSVEQLEPVAGIGCLQKT